MKTISLIFLCLNLVGCAGVRSLFWGTAREGLDKQTFDQSYDEEMQRLREEARDKELNESH